MTTHETILNPGRLGLVAGEVDLAERLRVDIDRRASGRVRDLNVVCTDGMIILMGRSRTYHAKQLAQEAVLDLTDGQTVLANQIVVA